MSQAPRSLFPLTNIAIGRFVVRGSHPFLINLQSKKKFVLLVVRNSSTRTKGTVEKALHEVNKIFDKNSPLSFLSEDNKDTHVIAFEIDWSQIVGIDYKCPLILDGRLVLEVRRTTKRLFRQIEDVYHFYGWDPKNSDEPLLTPADDVYLKEIRQTLFSPEPSIEKKQRSVFTAFNLRKLGHGTASFFRLQRLQGIGKSHVPSKTHASNHGYPSTTSKGHRRNRSSLYQSANADPDFSVGGNQSHYAADKAFSNVAADSCHSDLQQGLSRGQVPMSPQPKAPLKKQAIESIHNKIMQHPLPTEHLHLESPFHLPSTTGISALRISTDDDCKTSDKNRGQLKRYREVLLCPACCAPLNDGVANGASTAHVQHLVANYSTPVRGRRSNNYPTAPHEPQIVTQRSRVTPWSSLPSQVPNQGRMLVRVRPPSVSHTRHPTITACHALLTPVARTRPSNRVGDLAGFAFANPALGTPVTPAPVFPQPNGLGASVGRTPSIPAPARWTVASQEFHSRTVILSFSDMYIPNSLQQFIRSEIRLIKLYESGIPPWAVFLPSFGVWYRPWLRWVTWALSIALSAFSMACGFYDLYKNVPYLKAAIAAITSQLYLYVPASGLFAWLEAHTQIRLSILLTYLLSKSPFMLALIQYCRAGMASIAQLLQPSLTAIHGALAPIRAVLALPFRSLWWLLRSSQWLLSSLLMPPLRFLWYFASLLHALFSWAAICLSSLLSTPWYIFTSLQAALVTTATTAWQQLNMLLAPFLRLWSMLQYWLRATRAIASGSSAAMKAVGPPTTRTARWRIWYSFGVEALDLMRLSFLRLLKSVRAVLNFFVAMIVDVSRHRFSLHLQLRRLHAQCTNRVRSITRRLSSASDLPSPSASSAALSEEDGVITLKSPGTGSRGGSRRGTERSERTAGVPGSSFVKYQSVGKLPPWDPLQGFEESMLQKPKIHHSKSD